MKEAPSFNIFENWVKNKLIFCLFMQGNNDIFENKFYKISI